MAGSTARAVSRKSPATIFSLLRQQLGSPRVNISQGGSGSLLCGESAPGPNVGTVELDSKSQAPEKYQILLGNTQLYSQTQHSQKISVNQIIIHPDFEKFHAFGSDIAMLQLSQPVNFTSYVVPACLPSLDLQLPSHASCWITGWGMLTEDSEGVWETGREGKVGLIENKFCNILYAIKTGQAQNYSVHEEMLCAGDLTTGKAICQGDSGGPLICSLPRTWVLVGLASWGLSCRHPTYPSIYTRVAYFTDWIERVKRLTPLPKETSIPAQAHSSFQPKNAAGFPRPYMALMPPQIWLLPPLTLEVLSQALW
ncbi:Putative serine protease 47 [Tupaia chinensis]|uniref:Putative serine protease 47 n=1 Tax=Tupaia chinensis TaxID=246437 RepID=L9JN14_TUPCH|nr:Putative serine protease 47 [Tupaia chinensis]